MNAQRQHVQDFADELLEVFRSQRFRRRSSVPIDTLSAEEAYDVQQLVIDARMAGGERIAGYKVGCTSPAIHRQFGLTEPVFGRLMHAYVHHGEATLNWHDYLNCAVEPEFVLHIGRDITDADVDLDTLVDAIDWVAAGIEVHHARYWHGRPSHQELVASNGLHACLVVGPQMCRPAGLNLADLQVDLLVDGTVVATGHGRDIMGGPLSSLRWLVGRLARRGLTLAAGQLVIPGSPVELVHVEPNTVVRTTISKIGDAEATFRGGNGDGGR